MSDSAVRDETNPTSAGKEAGEIAAAQPMALSSLPISSSSSGSASRPAQSQDQDSQDLSLSVTPTRPTGLSQGHPLRSNSTSFAEATASSYSLEPPSASSSASAHTRQASSESLMPSLVLDVCAACAQGNATRLEALLHPADSNNSNNERYPSSFELVNTPHPHTGLSPLGYAASHGYLHLVQMLLQEGAMMVEDPSGETPLHVAAYKGHAAVLEKLIEAGDHDCVNAVDSDLWTPIHNACAKGWLDIVQMLVAHGANPDQTSRLGYTPLMNAASKGHLPVINYLLQKKLVDPFFRNKNGEAAYDTASASEPYVCEILSAHEAKMWAEQRQGSQMSESEHMPYNPLAFHVNYVAMLHENQRLDLRITSLGHRANFTSSALSKSDARSPFTLPPSHVGVNATSHHLPVFRSDLGLPTIHHPFQLVLPPMAHAYAEQRQHQSGGGQDSNLRAGEHRTAPRAFRSLSGSSFRTMATVNSDSSYFAASSMAQQQQEVNRNTERSHFWITDWFVDLSSPTVDPSEGWEYATSFDAPADRWTSEPPPELRRLMEQPGIAMGGSSKWVRRRRWVRVMRRRLDRPSLPFADLDGPAAALHATSASTSAEAHSSDREVGALGDLPTPEADYVARARYTAGVGHRLGSRAEPAADSGSMRSGKTASRHSDAAAGKAEARRLILRLENAITELRHGLLSDEDLDRIQQAQALLETYTSRLAEIKTSAGQELMSSQDEVDEEAHENEDEEEEFIYRPSTSHGDEEGTPTTGSAVASPSISINRAPSLDRALSQTTTFRVPTREAPVLRSSPSSHGVPVAVPVGPTWQPDEEASHCLRCNVAFSLFRRKHHCRRCGKVVCATCSNNSDRLDPSDVVVDPNALLSVTALQQRDAHHRTCNACHAEIEGRLLSPEDHPGGLSLDSDLLSTIVSPLQGPGSPLSSSVSSQTSVLQECPVCGLQLATLGNQADQEEHIRRCLDEGKSIAHAQRYLVFKLGQSPLVGSDCVICFEELSMNDEVARLPCLCFYHRRCIAAWMARDRGCPVHSRD